MTKGVLVSKDWANRVNKKLNETESPKGKNTFKSDLFYYIRPIKLYSSFTQEEDGKYAATARFIEEDGHINPQDIKVYSPVDENNKPEYETSSNLFAIYRGRWELLPSGSTVPEDQFVINFTELQSTDSHLSNTSYSYCSDMLLVYSDLYDQTFASWKDVANYKCKNWYTARYDCSGYTGLGYIAPTKRIEYLHKRPVTTGIEAIPITWQAYTGTDPEVLFYYENGYQTYPPVEGTAFLTSPIRVEFLRTWNELEDEWNYSSAYILYEPVQKTSAFRKDYFVLDSPNRHFSYDDCPSYFFQNNSKGKNAYVATPVIRQRNMIYYVDAEVMSVSTTNNTITIYPKIRWWKNAYVDQGYPGGFIVNVENASTYEPGDGVVVKIENNNITEIRTPRISNKSTTYPVLTTPTNITHDPVNKTIDWTINSNFLKLHFAIIYNDTNVYPANGQTKPVSYASLNIPSGDYHVDVYSTYDHFKSPTGHADITIN